MITTNLIGNIKWLLFCVVAILVIWFYKDYKHQIKENNRLTENAQQQRRADSIRFNTQNLTRNELNDYLEYENKELKKKLDQDRIKLSRIEQIISSKYAYSDNSENSIALDSILNAVQLLKAREQEVIDSSSCLTVKGKVVFDGKKLSLNITDRQFNNDMNGVVYWQRKQWNFLGIKTRFLGKKEFTAKVYDKCGETNLTNIQVEKK